MRIALGFRAHSGWAAMVAVTGTARAPEIVDRRRIVMADLVSPRGKQPYHAAAELPFAQAEEWVRSAIVSAREAARDEIAVAAEEMRDRGYEVVGSGVLFASGRALPDLAAILAAHPLIHTAEGVLYREALVWGSQACALPVTRLREKELDPSLLKRLDGFGKWLGPPWTQDQKYGAAAALAALESK
jgi:hypothetical protein